MKYPSDLDLRITNKTRARSASATRRHLQPRRHSELVEAARAAAGLWSKRPVTGAQIKKLRKRLGYL